MSERESSGAGAGEEATSSESEATSRSSSRRSSGSADDGGEGSMGSISERMIPMALMPMTDEMPRIDKTKPQIPSQASQPHYSHKDKQAIRSKAAAL